MFQQELPMHPLCDGEIARAALEIVRPMYESMLEAEITKRRTLYVVIMHPRMSTRCEVMQTATWGEGDRRKWDDPFQEIAESKARLSWQTGKPTSWLQQCASHFMSTRDTIRWGSDVLDENLVTACSGDYPYFDEAVAGTINLVMRALVKEKHLKLSSEVHAEGRNFFEYSEARLP